MEQVVTTSTSSSVARFSKSTQNFDPIYYLSCLPGVGKTRLAVQKMTAHLQKSEGIIVYVAPTILLLNEIRTYLERALEDPEKMKIRMVVSTPDQSSVAHTLLCLLLNSPLPDGQTPRPLLGGSVILMTHKGFLTLPDSLPRKDEMTVFFDEAHKFTAQLQPVMFKNKKESRLFKRLIQSNSSVVLNQVGRDTGFRKFSLKAWPKVVKKITQSSVSRKQYASLSDVIESAMNDRSDVYVKEHSRKGRHSFYEVTMPSRVFDGYSLVILMSAFLEDTQMWHLLEGKRTLLPLWEHPQFRRIKPRIDKFTARIKNKFARVCIFPLTEQDRPLSINRMNNAVMVPANKLLEIQSELEELGITSVRRLLDVANRKGIIDPTENELKAIQALKTYKAKKSPFNWYMNEAKTFLGVLRSEGRVSGKTLVAVNDANIKLLSEQYPEFTRISTISHGLNRYLSSNTLIFTAALNPEPEMSTLYKALLPRYDYIRDHLADSCTQAVTRLCVRDVDSEVVAYVILPDMAMAELLRNKMLNRPIISTRAIRGDGMTALTTLNTKRKVPTKDKRPLVGDKATRWRSDDINKALASRRASRSRLRRQLKDEPKNKTLLHKISELDTAINKLLSQKGQK